MEGKGHVTIKTSFSGNREKTEFEKWRLDPGTTTQIDKVTILLKFY